jgi:hypothetical protein
VPVTSTPETVACKIQINIQEMSTIATVIRRELSSSKQATAGGSWSWWARWKCHGVIRWSLDVSLRDGHCRVTRAIGSELIHGGSEKHLFAQVTLASFLNSTFGEPTIPILFYANA